MQQLNALHKEYSASRMQRLNLVVEDSCILNRFIFEETDLVFPESAAGDAPSKNPVTFGLAKAYSAFSSTPRDLIKLIGTTCTLAGQLQSPQFLAIKEQCLGLRDGLGTRNPKRTTRLLQHCINIASTLNTIKSVKLALAHCSLVLSSITGTEPLGKTFRLRIWEFYRRTLRILPPTEHLLPLFFFFDRTFPSKVSFSAGCLKANNGAIVNGLENGHETWPNTAHSIAAHMNIKKMSVAQPAWVHFTNDCFNIVSLFATGGPQRKNPSSFVNCMNPDMPHYPHGHEQGLPLAAVQHLHGPFLGLCLARVEDGCTSVSTCLTVDIMTLKLQASKFLTSRGMHRDRLCSFLLNLDFSSSIKGIVIVLAKTERAAEGF
ncbi:hypothetical protein VNO77_03009 [Canavalia gladiata]|uniref:Uncharacterized protein n=1 Tax=Canavalia gladiata TaxID=3824 RepID=A0AAN9MUN0_CANGL